MSTPNPFSNGAANQIANAIQAQSLQNGFTQSIFNAWLAGIDSLKQTAAEISLGIVPTDFSYFEGDIRRYGALTSASNNATAINNALLVSANGGAAAYIPPGIWKHTSTLNCMTTCSMYGSGQLSVLAPQSCDGLTFTNQGNSIAGRFFKDFVISGTSVSTNRGIVALMTAASGNLVVGILYQNLVITGGFLYAVYGYGWWETLFLACQSFNNKNGWAFYEQSIKVALRDCLLVRSPVATHGDGSIGFTSQQLSGVRPQDVTAYGCFIYGFDQGVFFGDFVVAALDNCDIDQTQSIGVEITTANGGCRVRNCWINIANVLGSNGILIDNLGSPNNDAILIDGNYIITSSTTGSSVGVSVGGDQLAVTVTNNTIGSLSASSSWTTGISITASNSIAKFNTINAATADVLVNSSATFVDVGPNVHQGSGALLATSSLTPGNFRFNGSGTFPGVLTGMASGGTGTLDWVAHEGMVTIVIPDAISMTGVSNATTMTLTGLPTYLAPAHQQDSFAIVFDNGVAALGFVRIATSGVVTFLKDFAGDPFTNTGTKGLQGGSFTYAYL